MNDALISIIILNYNRPVLGEWVLKFLDQQESKNFEVIFVDNGSSSPVSQKTLDELSYPITVLKCSHKLHNAQLNAALQIASGKIIMPFVADDDFFLPNTTKMIEKVFNAGSIDILTFGTCKYDFKTNHVYLEPENSKEYTGKVYSYPARDVAFGYISNWGIGEVKPQPLKVCGHASATAISRDVLKRTLSKQGELILGPFGDVGLIGPFLQTKLVHKLDFPLVLIGTNHNQDSKVMKEFHSNGERKTSRLVWEHLSKYIKHSPIKGITHFNLGVESHLQVLVNNGFDVTIPDDLRVDFYMNHLNAVIVDDPWSEQSENDFKEGIEQLQTALIREGISNYKQIIDNYVFQKNKHIENIKNKPSTVETVDEDQPYNYNVLQEVINRYSEWNNLKLVDTIDFYKAPKVIDYQKF